jgi:hypothetical protein
VKLEEKLKMNAKKVLSFLLCSSAFTKRNISSLGLVAFFFFVYVLAGGKIDTAIPSPSKIGAFGSGETDGVFDLGKVSKDKSAEVLGITRSKERADRENAPLVKGRIFNSDEREVLESEEIDRSGLIDGSEARKPSLKERKAIDQSTRKEVDPLLAVEERLHRLRK